MTEPGHRRRLGPRDSQVTSRMMAAGRNKDSKAELALRRELHARGMRYRLHARDVPGRPDLVIRSRRLTVFVDGDMWHGNEHRRRGMTSIAELFPHSHRLVGGQDQAEYAARSRGQRATCRSRLDGCPN